MRTVLESWRQEEAQATHSSQGEASEPIIDTSSLDLNKTEQERQREVDRALRLVDAAMKKAEGQLTHIPNLPSARLRRKVTTILHDMHRCFLFECSLMSLVRCTIWQSECTVDSCQGPLFTSKGCSRQHQ